MGRKKKRDRDKSSRIALAAALIALITELVKLAQQLLDR